MMPHGRFLWSSRTSRLTSVLRFGTARLSNVFRFFQRIKMIFNRVELFVFVERRQVDAYFVFVCWSVTFIYVVFALVRIAQLVVFVKFVFTVFSSFCFSKINKYLFFLKKNYYLYIIFFSGFLTNLIKCGLWNRVVSYWIATFVWFHHPKYFS